MEIERVQAIASLSMPADTIPSEFIRSEGEQPVITTVKGSVLEVPTIDMSGGGESESESAASALVEAIVRASSEWGMFQVVNHGIPGEVISRMQQAGKEFFELPQEEKQKYAARQEKEKEQEQEDPSSLDGSNNNNSNKHSSFEGYWGNLQMGSSSVPDEKKAWNDHLFHKIWPPSCINYKFWPKSPLNYREVNEEYCQHLRGVAQKLFECLSVGLGLEDGAMLEASGGDELQYLMKINYYPQCPRPDLVLGVPAHTDMSTFTILVPNEVPGLQVFRDEHWYEVKYIPNALVVHIGDQIEIMSNGKYKAVRHRTTVSKDKVRMSWPVFLEPPPEKEIGPLIVIDENNNNHNQNGYYDQQNLPKPKYKTKKYSDYVYCKLHKLPQ